MKYTNEQILSELKLYATGNYTCPPQAFFQQVLDIVQAALAPAAEAPAAPSDAERRMFWDDPEAYGRKVGHRAAQPAEATQNVAPEALCVCDHPEDAHLLNQCHVYTPRGNKCPCTAFRAKGGTQ
jgi:hypothetical protein